MRYFNSQSTAAYSPTDMQTDRVLARPRITAYSHGLGAFLETVHNYQYGQSRAELRPVVPAGC